MPYGVRGAFNGASIVFFSYIGFDAVATAAEETRDPRRDLPLGILSSVACVTALYTLMATTLVLMVPVADLRGMANASFAAAFNYVGWHWATYIVAVRVRVNGRDWSAFWGRPRARRPRPPFLGFPSPLPCPHAPPIITATTRPAP